MAESPVEPSFNRRLEDRRHRLGLTQEELAEKLSHLAWELHRREVGLDATAISKWERGARQPSRYYQYLLARFFETTPEDLGFSRSRSVPKVPSWGRGLVREDEPDQDIDDESLDMERRSLLRAFGILGTEVAASLMLGPLAGKARADDEGSRPAAVSKDLLEELRKVTTGYERMRRRVPAALLIGPVTAHVEMLREFLDKGSLWPDERQSLLSNFSQATSLMSWLEFFDRGDRGAGRIWLAKSVEAAEESGDPQMRVLGLIRAAEQRTYDGKGAEAVQLLEHGQRLAARRSSPNVLSWVCAAKAEAYATLHQVTPCLRLLDLSADAQQRSRCSEEPSWVEYWDSSRLAGYIGACHMRMEQPAEARAALTEALTEAEATDTKYRSIYLMDVAATHAQEREVEEACRFASLGLDIAGPMHYGTTLERAVQLKPHLAHWSSEPCVKEWNERLVFIAPG